MDADWLWKTLDEVQAAYTKDKKRWKEEKKHLKKEVKENVQQRLEYLESQVSLVQSSSNSSTASPSLHGVELAFEEDEEQQQQQQPAVTLTRDAQEELVHIAAQIKEKHERQTAKLREKLQVAEEILGLVDDQHQAELKDLKLDYEEKFQKMDRENQELHQQLTYAQQQQASTQRELQSLQQQMELLMSERPLQFTHLSPPSSPHAHEHYDEQLDRAIAERDLAIQDAMRYWDKCTKEIASLRTEHVKELDQVHEQCRQEYHEQLDELKQKHEEEILQYYKEISVLRASKAEGKDPKYMACVQKRHELSQKVKQLEAQATAQRHEWKLSLETARAQAKKEQQSLLDQIEKLEQDLREKSKSDSDHQDLLDQILSLEQELEERKKVDIKDQLKQQRHELDKEWRDEWQRRENMWNDQVETLRTEHQAEIESKDAEIELYERENSKLLEENGALNEKLNLNRTLLETEERRRETFELERKRLEEDLDRERSVKDQLRQRQSDSYDEQKKEQKMSQMFQDHQKVVMNTVEDLRQDLQALCSTMESSNQTNEAIGKANFDEIADQLSDIQNSLNEAVAELTLETEAMMVCRDELVKRSADYQSHQESMIVDFNSIKEYVESDKIRYELTQQLQRKDDELKELREKLDSVREELRGECSQRERSEAEADRLRDQAEAYSEEMMQLESSKLELEEKLRESDRKLEAALLTLKMAEQQASEPISPPQSPLSPAKKEDMHTIDDALELARNFGNTINGGGGANDKSVIEMLESLSDLMEKHDKSRSEDSDDRRHRESIEHTLSAIEVTAKDVPSPLESIQSARKASSIELVVEQLYSRCQMLERERNDLIHSTLDLLEAARDSSAAEINAALATAHRQTIEDLTELKRKNQEAQYKMYEKMCRQCRSGLLTNG